jgi:hypothetical protein
MDHTKVQMVLSGKDHYWSSSLYTMLEKMPYTYIFLWLDDIFLTAPVESEKFDECFQFMEKTGANHIHMHPKPLPNSILSGGPFGIYEKGMPYRVNALGFWRVAYLKKLLLRGENPWNFEIMGSYRSSYDDGFYCINEPLFSSLHMVEKGKYFSQAFEYCKNHHIHLDGKRAVLRYQSGFQSLLQAGYFTLMMHMSWRRRVSIMNTLRKLFISY